MFLPVACFAMLVARVLAQCCDNHLPDKLKVSVYYGALCGDSQRFITDQLSPTWKKLRHLIDLDLVPYGKCVRSKKNDQWIFNCEHGRGESYGNKIQACILRSESLNEDDKMDLITCLMSQSRPHHSLRLCLSDMKKMDVCAELKQCAESKEGDELLAFNGVRTDAVQYPLKIAPTIVINGEYDEEIQTKAQKDFELLLYKYV